MKKYVALLLFFVFVLMMPETAFAAGFDSIKIEQVNANLPEVTAYFYLVDGDGNDINDFVPEKEKVSAIFGDSQIEIVSFGKAENIETTYYYLLDVSTSVSKSVFAEVKEVIKEHIEGKTSGEKIVVITFGKDITVVLDGNESPEEAAEKIDGMKPNETATRLFDGLDKILTLSANDTDGSERKIAVLVSDGADLYNGGATKDEVLERIVNANIVLYSMALPNSGKNGLDAMESFSKSSGGEIFSLKSGKTGESFGELFSKIDNCLVLKMRTDSNIIKNAFQTFVVKIPYGETELEASCEVKTTKWIKDETVPEITEIKSVSSSKIEVTFSENVDGAEDPSNYSLYNIGEEKNIEITSVSYSKNSLTATIVVAEDIYNGEYQLKVMNIKDISMEGNDLGNQEETFTVLEEGRERPLTSGEKLAKHWYIILVVVLVVAAAIAPVIIFAGKVSKKKEEKAIAEKKHEEEFIRNAAIDAVEKGIKNSVENSDMGHIRINSEKIASKKVTLVINENGELQKSMDVMINGEYIIGRSESCNLSFNDKSMSREHCALCYINGVLVIKDLSSTNGTSINGICIKGVYCLNDGDVINFGKTKITVRFAKG